ncbi:MAG: V-type ATPase subunit [Anaerolineales bacterium]|nr:V-type ATPase subunit [Anaerolineales bacterium]
MSASGVSGYAAISARVRAMYSSLLSPQDMSRLSDSPDFSTLISQLKNTVYAPYLENLKDKELTPGRVDSRIKGRLAGFYYSVIHMAPEHARPIIKQLYRYFEVQNLKAVLRGIVVTDPSWERVRDVLFPMGSMTVLPAQAMLEAGNVSAAVELLQGTMYYETLSFAMKRYSAEQTLFPLEVALDLYYWRQLWQEAKKLQGQDRDQALRVVGSLMDMNNLMWVIRYRVYHQLSEEELINYTLPFGYHVRDADVRAIAAGADLATVVTRVYPDIPNVNVLLEEPRSGLPQLEQELKRHVMKQCLASFTGNPFHIGLPLAFLVLGDLEIQDLTVLIEAKSSRMPDEEFRPYLLRSVAA